MIKIDLESLEKKIPNFKSFLNTEAQPWLDERKKKDDFFANYFSKGKLSKLDAGVLRELIHILWAFNVWTNKDYLLNEMLKSGLDNIREAFEYLLYSNDTIAKRYDFTREKVRMLGAAGISEILIHHDHNQFPIWNRRTKRGLFCLGISKNLLPQSSQISGSQYQSFCKLMHEVKNLVSFTYSEIKDLFELDFLLYFLSLSDVPEINVAEEETATIDFDHDAVINQVLELGDGLGFEVEKEFVVVPGCKIDAIWRSRIANLGTIAYAFEIHRKGSRDSAILNLQRVNKDVSIQKVIIVSIVDEIAKFRNEIASLDESFRNSVSYLSINELQLALNHLDALKKILKTLGLLKTESSFD